MIANLMEYRYVGFRFAQITLRVNDEQREVFTRDGDVEFIEDHTQHFQHSDTVEVRYDLEIF